RETVADPGESQAEIGHPGQAQPHRKQQIGEQPDDDRRLQLKTPADRRPAGAQHQEAAAKRRKAQDHPQRVSHRVMPLRPMIGWAAASMIFSVYGKKLRLGRSRPASALSGTLRRISCAVTAKRASNSAGCGRWLRAAAKSAALAGSGIAGIEATGSESDSLASP